MVHERFVLGGALLLCACTVQSDDNAFGSASTTVATSVGTTVPSSDSGGDGSSSGAGSTSDGDDGSSTGAADSGDTGSSSTTDDPTLEGSSGAVDPTDGQPADGMYSPCLEGADCGNQPNLCIQSVDADMNPIDGFCSTTGCANPAIDCDPAPGGTAMPTCVPITVNDMAAQACALNCQGLTCPTGMACASFTGLGMICM